LYRYCGNASLTFSDPSGELGFLAVLGAAVAAVVVGAVAVVAYQLNFGDKYAMTIKGTRMTFYGRNYWRLHPSGRRAITTHEEIHQNESFFHGFFNRAISEVPAYLAQYEQAFWDATVPGASEDEKESVRKVFDDARLILKYEYSVDLHEDPRPWSPPPGLVNPETGEAVEPKKCKG
jgi:hypothetical protein